jgi:colanic acid biosynthesis glycosyl transferase WcaI
VKVTVVSCVYPPEPVVSARTSADIVAALEAGGQSATVICPFPSRPQGRIYDGFKRRWHERSVSNGSVMIRCASFISARSVLVSRFLENLTFGISSAAALLRGPRPDVVFLNTWPVFATAFAAFVARLRRVPYVLSVQDVYPESLLVQERMAARLLAPLLRWIDGSVARKAAALIVLSEAFASIYRNDRRVDPSRIHVIPNWLDDLRQPAADEAAAFRRRWGVGEDEFLVLYGGNIGVAAEVERLIGAFRHVHSANVHLLIAGGGARLQSCRDLAAGVAPGRIHFHTPWPPEETAVTLAAANLLALPTSGDQSHFSVPSKLISYLFAGRPILAAAHHDSELARIMRESDAGWVVPPGDEESLARAIVEAAATPEERLRVMSVQGREYARERFSRDRCVSRVLDILRSSAR